jgi:hypothetical protein
MNVLVRKHLDSILVRLPIRLVSEANARGHWSAKHRRASGQRNAALMALRPQVHGMSGPWWVLITRVAPRRLDSDNLQTSAKAIRDGIAEALGVNDGDESAATWVYDQRKAEFREPWTVGGGYGVEICLEARRGRALAPGRAIVTRTGTDGG